jgi:hypothetical protein
VLKIFTISHTRPDFIDIQMRSFQKYLDESFEFVVLNNAAFNARAYDSRNYEEINRQCALSGATVIDVIRDPVVERRCQDQETTCSIFDSRGRYPNPNVACSYPICWAWEKHISKVVGPVVLLHSDVFLTHSIRLTDTLQEHDICYIPQYRAGAAEYMWDAFFLADLSRLPQPETLDWWGGKINGVAVDVGGQTSRYLAAHQYLRPLRIHTPFIPDDPDTNFHPTNYEQLFFNERLFGIHYRSGSNWNNFSAVYHEKKTKWLLEKLNLKG